MGITVKKKRWPWFFAIPLIIIFASMLALKLYFTDERLKALIVPKIESSTHRNVVIDDISFSFFPGIGITLTGFTLSNPPGGGFAHPHLLTMKSLFVDVKLMPLLSNRLEVNNLVLEEPVVYLDVTADGRKNTSTGGGARVIGDAADSATTEGGATSQLGAFVLSNMEITDGRIESHNRRLDSRWVFSGLRQTMRLRTDQEANAVVLEGEIDVREFSYGSGSSWYMENLPLSGTAALTYFPTDDSLGLGDVSLKLKGVPFRISGSVIDLQRETYRMNLTVDSPELTVGNLLSLFPAEMAQGASEVTASGNASFSMLISGRSNDTLNPSVHASFIVTDGSVRYPSVSKSITSISLDGVFDLPEAPVGSRDAGRLELRKFSASLGANTISGKMLVSGFGNPTINCSLRGNIALDEIREYYPLGEGTRLSGSVSSDVNIDGPPLEPKLLRASGSMKLRDVSYSTPAMTRPLRALSGDVTFNNQLLVAKNLTMEIGESDIRLNATLRNYLALAFEGGESKGATPFLEFALKSKRLNTADISSGEGDPGDGGRVSGTPTSGTTGGALFLPGMDMTGTMEVESLKTEKFSFTNTRGAITMTGGVAKLKNVSMEAFGGSVLASGSLDLRDPSNRPFDLNLDIREVESNSILTPFTTFGKYLFGKLTLSTSMKGDLDDTLGISTTTLTGVGTALIANGKLTGLPLLEKLSGYLSTDRLRDVDFKNWTQSFSVADGRLNVKELKIGGTDAEITVNGVHGLDGTIDYSMNIRLPEAVAAKITPRGVPAELLQFFRDEDGKMSFDFQVSGQSASPTLKLDTRAQENRLKKRLGEEAAKKLSDPLKKAAEGLKKLIKP